MAAIVLNEFGGKEPQNSATVVVNDVTADGTATVAALQERLALTESRLHHFEDANLDLRAQLAMTQSEKASGEDPERKQMYEQLKYKDNRIMELNNVIMEKERRIMDLVELCREQSLVASSKKAAVAIVNRRLRELNERKTRDASTEVDPLLVFETAGGGRQVRQNESPGRVRAAGRLCGPSPPPSDPSEAFTRSSDRVKKLASGRKRVTFDFAAGDDSSGGLTRQAPRSASVERGSDFTSVAGNSNALAEENKRLKAVLAEAQQTTVAQTKVEHKSTEINAERESTTTVVEHKTNDDFADNDNRVRIVKARAAAQSRIHELEENITSLQLSSAKELANANAIIETLNASREWLIQENATLLKKNETLKSKVDDLHGELDASVDTNTMYRQRLNDVERQADALANELADVRRSLHHAQDTKQVFISEVERLKEALFAQDELIGVLEGDLIVYEEHVGMLRDSLGASQREHRQTIKSKAYAAKLNALEMEKKEIMKRSNDDRLLAKALGVKVRCLETERDKLLQRLRQVELAQNATVYPILHTDTTPTQAPLLEVLYPVARGSADPRYSAEAESPVGDSDSSSPFAPIGFERSPNAAPLPVGPMTFEMLPSMEPVVPTPLTSLPAGKIVPDRLPFAQDPSSIAHVDWTMTQNQPQAALADQRFSCQLNYSQPPGHAVAHNWKSGRPTVKKEMLLVATHTVDTQKPHLTASATQTEPESLKRPSSSQHALDEKERQRLMAVIEAECCRADESIESKRRRADETIETMCHELNDGFQRRINELTARLAVYEEKAAAVGNQLTALLLRNESLTFERDEEKRKRTQTERLIAERSHSLCNGGTHAVNMGETVANNLERLALFITDLKQQLAAVTSERDAAALAGERTATDLAAQRAVIREFESAKIGLITLNDRLADERDELTRRVTADEAALAEMAARLAVVERQLSKADSETRRLGVKLSEAVQRESALIKDRNSSKVRIETAEISLVELTTNKEQLEQKIAVLRETNARLSAQLEHEKMRLERLIELLRSEVDRFRVEAQLSRDCLEDLRQNANLTQQRDFDGTTKCAQQQADFVEQQNEQHVDDIIRYIQQQEDPNQLQQVQNQEVVKQQKQQPITTSFDNFRDCFIVYDWPKQQQEQQFEKLKQQQRPQLLQEQQEGESEPNIVVDSVVRDLEEMVASTPIYTRPDPFDLTSDSQQQATGRQDSEAVEQLASDKADSQTGWDQHGIETEDIGEELIRRRSDAGAETETEHMGGTVDDHCDDIQISSQAEALLDQVTTPEIDNIIQSQIDIAIEARSDASEPKAELQLLNKSNDIEIESQSNIVDTANNYGKIDTDAEAADENDNDNGDENNEFAAEMLADIQRILTLKSELETSVDVLKSEIWSLNNQLRKQLIEHEETASRLRVCEQQLADAEARLRERDSDAMCLRAELVARGDNFARLCEEKARIETQSAALAKRCAQLQQELSAGAHLFEELTETRRLAETLELRNDELNAALDAERSTVVDLRIALDGRRDELAALANEKTRLDAEASGLRADFTKLQASYEALATAKPVKRKNTQTIWESDAENDGENEQQKNQQLPQQQSPQQQQKSRSLPSLPLEMPCVQTPPAPSSSAARRKYRSLYASDRSLGAPLTASLVHPLNVQLAILAARLDAKSADNEALQRSNAELAYANARLLVSVEALEARAAKISVAGSSEQLLTPKDEAAVLIPVKVANEDISEKAISCEMVLVQKTRSANINTLAPLTTAESVQLSVTAGKKQLKAKGKVKKAKTQKSKKNDIVSVEESTQQQSQSGQEADKTGELGQQNHQDKHSRREPQDSTILIDDGFAAARLFDAAIDGAAAVRAAVAGALFNLRIADDANPTEGVLSGNGFNALLDGLRPNAEKDTVEELTDKFDHDMSIDDEHRKIKMPEVPSATVDSEANPNDTATVQDEKGDAWDNDKDNDTAGDGNDTGLSAVSSRVIVVPFDQQLLKSTADSWDDSAWSDNDVNDEITVEQSADYENTIAQRQTNDADKDGSSWDW